MERNVNSISKLSYAHGLAGIRSSINYATKGKSHNPNVPNRVIALTSYNCSNSPKLAYNEMKAVFQKAGLNSKNISLIRDIETFKGLNYKNKNDVKKAIKINNLMISKEFPNQQILSAFQADNHKRILHVHNLVCARQFTNFKANSSSWNDVANQQDRALEHFGYKPLNNGRHLHTHRYSRGTLYHFKNDHSFIFGLNTKILNALHNSNNIHNFKKNLKAQHITLKPYLYKNYLHFAYKSKYNHRPIIIRDNKLSQQLKHYQNIRNYYSNHRPSTNINIKPINVRKALRNDNYSEAKEQQLMNKNDALNEAEAKKYKNIDKIAKITDKIAYLKKLQKLSLILKKLNGFSHHRL